MSVVASDIVIYASQNMPEDDTSTTGGAINSGVRVVFDDLTANDTLEALSADNADSGTLTITGRRADGAIVTDSFALSGTTLVSGSQTFERILVVDCDAVATGDITVRDASGDVTVGTIYENESGFRRPFYDATAEAAGGSAKTLYEKVFVKNNNTVNALLNASITEVSSGIYTLVTFGLERTLDSENSVANREAAPTGVPAYSNGPSGIPGTNLDPLSTDGMWLKFELAAGAAAQNSYYQFQVDGTTT